ncbi:MAG TPA: HEAT repeat domain-containing protein [Pirellulales bacterium]|nr:HEAT repeat domain-containing protein [Pirellulales bacterium]
MSSGLATTLRVLTKTKNEAVSAVLVPSLDCADAGVQEGALLAILQRYNVAGQREIVRRLHTINDRWRKILADNYGRMTAVLRDAVLSSEHQLCVNGCQAALWFREYDLMPALINAAEDEAHPNRNLAAATLLQLAELLYEELAQPRDSRRRRDPSLVREHVISALEKSVQRFSKHRRIEVLEAFLLLVNRDNCALKQILQEPHHPAFVPLIDMLAHSKRGGVMRLLLSFLDDPRAPSVGLNALAKRTDPKFIDYLLKKVGYEPSATASQNIKRLETISWLHADQRFVTTLDDASQHAAVQLAVRSGMNRQEVYQLLERLLNEGKVGGRRAAAQALAQFNGAQANGLALRTLQDKDPFVQAQIAVQLRPRGIPGALSKLVEMMSSPHEPVKQAARQSLDEFTFKKLLLTFDLLDDDNRRQTGELVAQVDPLAAEQLKIELTTASRTRRLRGLAMANAMQIADQVEECVLDLLSDDDYVIRAEAAKALSGSNSLAVYAALREMLADRSFVVQEAAEESLLAIATRHPAFGEDRLRDRNRRENPLAAGPQTPVAPAPEKELLR